MGSPDRVLLFFLVLLRLGSLVSEADPSADAVAEALADPGPLALADPGPLALADPGPLALADPGPDPEARNSLLTDRTLLSPFNPLASPFGPLSPNGVVAAHAAANLPHGLPHPLHPLAHGAHHPHHLPLVPHHPPLPRGGLHLHVPLGACSLVCSILDLLVFNPDFSTFISLVKAAGLVDLLSQPGPMTLFAPTNAAFDALPPPTFTALVSDKIALQALLLRHMSRGAIHYADMPPGPTPLITGAGERVTITAFPHEVHVSSILAIAQVIDLDNEAANGVVHVVDAVF